VLCEVEVPECFGKFICPDDCICSCPFWEDCMFEAEEMERDLEEACEDEEDC
jgi:hypothetical protein